MSAARDEYEKKILDSRKPQPEVEVPTEVKPMAEVGKTMGAQTLQTSSQQGDMLGTAGGAMMMSGNPYLMAAGAGITALSAGEKHKREQQDAQRQAYNQRIMDRQKSMQMIASQGIQ